ncbi:hypothetical protein C1645_856052 [Glomus cerebriforme]|uniref:F-box domain-containing protein n=1 Tax=Glomus cerebriforme TaxID=658196 RepID=A0A397TKK0_9GLOM|nr:hypothetical protein C1645_856052 [Glomus cerebriforme]
MSFYLPADCLNEIFEYLEDDKITLRSCLLVNRLWCEIVVRILWRNVWNFQYSVYKPYRRIHVPLTLIRTLISCLPNESKDLLYENEIFITNSTRKPSFFNYASFCKVLSIHEIDQMIQYVLEKHQSITSRKLSLNYNKYLLSQEILKMFMNEISSLKSLDYGSSCSKKVENIMFTYLPGAKNCLTDLTKLSCSSEIYSEFFYQISQICHNIQSLIIKFGDFISDGLADLITLQNNLKILTLQSYDEGNGICGIYSITSSLNKFSLSLTKLKIDNSYIPLSFISIFKNLQELSFFFEFKEGLEDFTQLQYVKFPNLKILRFLYEYPKAEILMKFLEINGKNLEELYIFDNDNSLNLAIAKFCPNLKTLFTIFMDDEIETLKILLKSCQYLESIKIWCGGGEYLNEKELLEIIAKYSPKNFYELKINYIYYTRSEIIPEDLESFFLNWKNRLPQKPLSLILIKNYESISLEVNEGNMEVIEKYKRLGVIKKIKIQEFEEEE